MLSENFMPHGHCYLWKPSLIVLHVVSDAVIVLAYFSIPLLLVYFVAKTKERLPFNNFFLLFAIFILACGTTHLMEIINVWEANYFISGLVKAVTAVASMGTAIGLVPIIPKAIRVISKLDE